MTAKRNGERKKKFEWKDFVLWRLLDKTFRLGAIDEAFMHAYVINNWIIEHMEVFENVCMPGIRTYQIWMATGTHTTNHAVTLHT